MLVIPITSSILTVGGQARRVLDNYVDKWDCTKEDHVNYEEAVTREVDRTHRRRYYKR